MYWFSFVGTIIVYTLFICLTFQNWSACYMMEYITLGQIQCVNSLAQIQTSFGNVCKYNKLCGQKVHKQWTTLFMYVCWTHSLAARIRVVNKCATYIRYGGSYTYVCVLFTGQEVFCYVDRKYVGQQLVVICLKMLHVLLFLCKDNPPFTFSYNLMVMYSVTMQMFMLLTWWPN